MFLVDVRLNNTYRFSLIEGGKNCIPFWTCDNTSSHWLQIRMSESLPGKSLLERFPMQEPDCRSVGTGIRNCPILTLEVACYLPLSFLWRQILQQWPQPQISPTSKQRTAEEEENLILMYLAQFCFILTASQSLILAQALTAHTVTGRKLVSRVCDKGVKSDFL